jgi:uncharacterized membrane protein YgcG
MAPNHERKIVAGGVAASLVLGLGAVAGAAAGVGPFARGGVDDVGATRLAGGTEVSTPTTPDTTPGSLPDDDVNENEVRVDGDRVETRVFVDIPEGDTETFAAGPAGFVTVGRTNGALRIVAVAPTAGFVVTRQQVEDGGREVDVRFAGGALAVRFDAELEDGQVRIRVRQRGGVPATTPVTLDDDDNRGPGGGDDDGDRSGPSGGDSGSGSSGGGNSGPGGGGSNGGGGSGPG